MGTLRFDVSEDSYNALINLAGFVASVGVLNYGDGDAIVGFGTHGVGAPDDNVGKYVPAGAYRVVRNTNDGEGSQSHFWVYGVAATSVELEASTTISYD